MTKSPDQIVAERIIDELRKKALIDENIIVHLAKKLAEGKISSEDWKLMAELEIEKVKGMNNGKSH